MFEALPLTINNGGGGIAWHKHDDELGRVPCENIVLAPWDLQCVCGGGGGEELLWI